MSSCSTGQGGDARKGRRQEERPGEAIILNISVKGGDFSRKAINPGTSIIRRNTVTLKQFQQ